MWRCHGESMCDVRVWRCTNFVICSSSIHSHSHRHTAHISWYKFASHRICLCFLLNDTPQIFCVCTENERVNCKLCSLSCRVCVCVCLCRTNDVRSYDDISVQSIKWDFESVSFNLHLCLGNGAIETISTLSNRMHKHTYTHNLATQVVVMCDSQAMTLRRATLQLTIFADRKFDFQNGIHTRKWRSQSPVIVLMNIDYL